MADRRPEIRQFPGVVCGDRVFIPVRDVEGFLILTDFGVSFFEAAFAREMGDQLEVDLAEETAAGHPWHDEPHIADAYRLLADVMDQLASEDGHG
jgi:hypothetical protein